MPYAKRRAYRKRPASRRNLKRIRYRRPSGREQRRQIASNQRQIVSLKRAVNLSKERIRWHCGLQDVAVTASVLCIPLTSGPQESNPAVVNTVIGEVMPWKVTMTSAPQVSPTIRSTYVINKQYVDLSFYAGNEPSTVQHTAFLVGLHPKTAQQVYQETSSMSTFIRHRDYVTNLGVLGTDSGYGSYMNPDRFKIIKRLEFETAGVATATGNTGQTGTSMLSIMRTQFVVNYGSTVFKSTGDNASGNTLEYAELPPHSKKFIIVFSNNIRTDLEYPNFSISSLVTGYCPE